MSVLIRPFRDDDAKVLAIMFPLSVKSTAPDFYTEEQVTIWADRMPDADELVVRARDGRCALVSCGETGQPVAYGELETDGHLDFLYCHPDHIGMGFASALYHQLEITARRLNLAEIFVEASEAALTFFCRKGFTTTKRRDFDMDGVKIHNYAMCKGLTR